MHFYSWGEDRPLEYTAASMKRQLDQFATLEEAIKEQREAIDDFPTDPKIGRVGLILDEWGTWDKSDEAAEAQFGKFWQQNTMRDALAAGLALNVFHRQADRLLGQALGEKLVQTCRVAGLCTHGALYALTRQGMGDDLPRSPAGLERALLQIEPLWGARNLLADLARRDALLQSVSPARLMLSAGPGSVVGSGATARLDVLAWGALAREPGQLRIS